MLYVFYGTDSEKAQRKAADTLHALQKKAPQASTVKLEGGAITEQSLLDGLAEHGLFKSETILYLDTRDGGLDVVLDHVQMCADSTNVVLLLAGKLTAAAVKKIEKTAQKSQEFEKVKAEKAVNMFVLSDLLLNKDTKGLFVELEHVRQSGGAAEPIVGILFWAAKSMLLAGMSSTAAISGLKPFVYQKSKHAFMNWGEDRARALVGALAHAPQKARGLGIDLFDELEAIVLR